MHLQDALSKLEALGNEKMRVQNLEHGAGENQFGVRRGEVRKLAKKITANHELALSRWETDNIDARCLAILLMKPKSLSSEEMDRMVRSVTLTEVGGLAQQICGQKPSRQGVASRGVDDDGRPHGCSRRLVPHGRSDREEP